MKHEGVPFGIAVFGQDITEITEKDEKLWEQLEEIKGLKEQLEKENIYLRQEIKEEMGFGKIIGSSEAIQYVIFRSNQVAPTDATVIILGETGVGKGMIANAIHENSSRKDRVMVTVNCAALPANLIESELFGREKGAFTGAHARQAGRFEVADRGTIFLDEIGELPLELQAKLLRVLQDGEFERLCSPRSLKVDVRVIASTSRDLKQEMRNGRFREDLFYRLNTFPVTIPPLRKRVEDIPELAKFFIDKYARKFGRKFDTMKKDTIQRLQSYDWPGNVRELLHVVEAAMVLCEGPVIRQGHLPAAVRSDTAGTGLARTETPAPSSAAVEGGTLTLAAVERSHIERVLHAHHGHRGLAAKALGISERNLYRKLREWGLT
jgi:transcriptional regulator with GAF, ATPase, and Fis domain